MHIYGASGHAKVIIESLLSCGEVIDGVYDDNPDITSILGYEVIGKFSGTLPKEAQLIIAIGNNAVREHIANSLSENFGNAVHTDSIISPSAKLGIGVAIMANTVVNADSIIGNHVIINTSASIDHDCIVHDFVHLAPNATLCGGVTIGKSTLVGAGSTIIPNIKVGANVMIGAGALITKDIPDNSTVVGHNRILEHE